VNKPIKFSLGVALQITGIAVLLLLLVLIIYGYVTGQRWVGVANKSLWDWLELLIVPVVLAVAGFVLSDAAQNEREREQSDRQAAADLAQRQREEMAVSRRAQNEALESYLNQMSDIIVDKQVVKKVRAGYEEKVEDLSEVRIAQARTLVILSGLDKVRKRDPLYLIYELGLIDRDNPILSLKKANFGGADLSEITLHEASLREADLRLTNLKGADLKGSDLSHTDLRGADLSDADLSEVNLAGANLLPYDKENPARLNAAHLANGVDTTAINFTDDHVVPTKMTRTNVDGADLSGAYLMGVVELSEQELERQAYSLTGATMPNGQKYEEWLKDKEGSWEDGENSAQS